MAERNLKTGEIGPYGTAEEAQAAAIEAGDRYVANGYSNVYYEITGIAHLNKFYYTIYYTVVDAPSGGMYETDPAETERLRREASARLRTGLRQTARGTMRTAAKVEIPQAGRLAKTGVDIKPVVEDQYKWLKIIGIGLAVVVVGGIILKTYKE